MFFGASCPTRFLEVVSNNPSCPLGSMRTASRAVPCRQVQASQGVSAICTRVPAHNVCQNRGLYFMGVALMVSLSTKSKRGTRKVPCKAHTHTHASASSICPFFPHKSGTMNGTPGSSKLPMPQTVSCFCWMLKTKQKTSACKPNMSGQSLVCPKGLGLQGKGHSQT